MHIIVRSTENTPRRQYFFQRAIYIKGKLQYSICKSLAESESDSECDKSLTCVTNSFVGKRTCLVELAKCKLRIKQRNRGRGKGDMQEKKRKAHLIRALMKLFLGILKAI